MAYRERQIEAIKAEPGSSPAMFAKMDAIRKGLINFRQNVVLLRDAERPDHFSPVCHPFVKYHAVIHGVGLHVKLYRWLRIPSQKTGCVSQPPVHQSLSMPTYLCRKATN